MILRGPERSQVSLCVMYKLCPRRFSSCVCGFGFVSVFGFFLTVVITTKQAEKEYILAKLFSATCNRYEE